MLGSSIARNQCSPASVLLYKQTTPPVSPNAPPRPPRPAPGALAPGTPATAAYSTPDLLGATPRFASMMPSGSPLVSWCHVVPPSVDLKMPPPGPPNSAPSWKPCCCTQRVA